MNLKEYLTAYDVSLRQLAALSGINYWTMFRHAHRASQSLVDYDALEQYLKQRNIDYTVFNWKSLKKEVKQRKVYLNVGDKFTIAQQRNTVYQIIEKTDTHYIIQNTAFPESKPRKWSYKTLYYRTPKKIKREGN